MDFLLVLIELFLLVVTAQALRANIGSKSAISLQRGPVDPRLRNLRKKLESFYGTAQSTFRYLEPGTHECDRQ